MPLPKCCTDLDIALADLVFPERMSPEGRDFFRVHGLDRVTLGELRRWALDLGNGMVKIFHRCDQLGDDGRCEIYEGRPRICREFDCRTRSDCECKGHGIIHLDSC
jgi:Fe-S-cluster containining protein